jgi:hypothetical protein
MGNAALPENVAAQLARRMLGAARLDVNVYEEVEADRSATRQAFVVVLLTALAGGVGTIANHGAEGIFYHALSSVLLWWVWAGITSLIGTRLLPTAETVADHGELLRTIGFSSSPGLLMLLCLVDPIAGYVFGATLLWMLVAMVVAVRQALDYTSTLRALAVCAIGFPVYLLGLLATTLLLGPWPL